ncbi:hypothetical protein BJV82DRAFT_668791 [Fennellomyces sp. T-0311]|nr:hypothetical protein BJV82DRAFT_668791 [Fennellomyces sp. T-0311]
MSSEEFMLPTELNVPEFWKQSYMEWKNITKYDFRYISTTLTAKKSEAHIAYRQDIESMMQATKQISRMQQTLAVCKKVLKDISKDIGNAFFWETEAESSLKLAVASLTVELQVARQKSAADVLGELGSHESNPRLSSDSTDGTTNDDVAGTTPKRSAEEDQSEPAKTSRIRVPIFVEPFLNGQDF